MPLTQQPHPWGVLSNCQHMYPPQRQEFPQRLYRQQPLRQTERDITPSAPEPVTLSPQTTRGLSSWD